MNSGSSSGASSRARSSGNRSTPGRSNDSHRTAHRYGAEHDDPDRGAGHGAARAVAPRVIEMSQNLPDCVKMWYTCGAPFPVAGTADGLQTGTKPPDS
jgi:hypothetical protein